MTAAPHTTPQATAPRRQPRSRLRSVALWLATALVTLPALAAFSSVPLAVAAVAAQGQVVGPLPPLLDLDAVAAQTVALHRANGGATVSLYYGDLSGQLLYVVDVYPEVGVVVPGAELDAALVRRFIAANLGLLTDPRNAVGTWLNPDDGNTYLDVSTALPSREQALALAHQYNQMGVFDLYELDMIDTGGTGEPPPNLPPIAQRLPPLPPGLLQAK